MHTNNHTAYFCKVCCSCMTAAGHSGFTVGCSASSTCSRFPSLALTSSVSQPPSSWKPMDWSCLRVSSQCVGRVCGVAAAAGVAPYMEWIKYYWAVIQFLHVPQPPQNCRSAVAGQQDAPNSLVGPRAEGSLRQPVPDPGRISADPQWREPHPGQEHADPSPLAVLLAHSSWVPKPGVHEHPNELASTSSVHHNDRPSPTLPTHPSDPTGGWL